MIIEELVGRFPEEVRIGTHKSGHFTRISDHFATHAGAPAPDVAGPGAPGPGGVAESIERLEAEGITLWRGGSTLAVDDLPPVEVTAIYSASPESPLAVPTGQVFAQLTKGLRAGDHAEIFAKAGYEIAKTIVYAPHAAWLRARSGDAAEALRRIPELEALAEIDSVEPQMLSARALRHST